MSFMAVTVPVVAASGQRLMARLAYDPATNPLVMGLAIGTAALDGRALSLSRHIVMEAYAQPMILTGVGGPVRVRVRDTRTAELRLMSHLPSHALLFLVSTQSLMAFVQGTREQVPVCLRGACERVGCFECAWLRRQISDCSCGVVGCDSFRLVDFPEQECL